ncbi:MAG TPA: hypothetical protein VFZ98_10630 [Vicinamibacterales bacterium]
MKFLILYHSTVSARDQMAGATPEQMKAGMEAWMAWANSAKGAIVDLGAPVGNGVTMTSPSAESPSTSSIGGFSVLQADSKAALLKTLSGHPHFRAPGASIEVLEFMPMGM